ncbi:MAG: KUP/HAK/KT family potassium transporter [Phycisphaerales bacterium]|nr:KUP/HAK/KT family potassium transporter [Phycisphaerales bacterium]
MADSSPAQTGLVQDAAVPSKGTLAVSFASLGIVFGDIGTSPLYTMNACFQSTEFGVTVGEQSVLGVLSLVFWAMLLVLSIKYLSVLLRAQYEGEGGIFALLALIMRGRSKRGSTVRTTAIVMVAIVGAALLYGDGIVTPAISVLSAVEGLEQISPRVDQFIVPIAAVVLACLFLWQRVGTQRIAIIFSPLMLLWFIAIGVLGLMAIRSHPDVLVAVNPMYAIALFQDQPWHAFLLLSLIVLCVTGAEALYADLGQFSRKSITLAWCTVVWPSLLLSYFGQGAWLLSQTNVSAWRPYQESHVPLGNPFFEIIPDSMTWPMIILATIAACIASQAIISGAFSLTRQAVQMRILPYLRIIHTSHETEGQVYIPAVNRIMFFGSIAAVVIFMSPERLASAYGIAVTAVMTTTTLLLAIVARQVWGWPLWKYGPMILLFLIIDLSFLSANVFKLGDGGWFPIGIACVLILLMTTWLAGRRALSKSHPDAHEPLEPFLKQVKAAEALRVPGTGVFLTGASETAPSALVALFSRFPVVYERVIIVSMVAAPVARLPRSRQLEVKELGNGFTIVCGRFGYLQVPNVPRTLQLAINSGLEIDLDAVTYYTRREIVVTSGPSDMFAWRKGLYSWMARNASSMSNVFELPAGKVVEIGLRVDL